MLGAAGTRDRISDGRGADRAGQANRSPVRLRRGNLARSFGGWNFQWTLALSLLVAVGPVVVVVVVVVLVAALVGSMSLLRGMIRDPLAWLGLVWWAIWAMGRERTR